MLIKTDIFKANLIQMLQTTRVGGYSDKPYDSLNLGVFGKDPKVIENIEFLTHKNSLPHSPVFMQQIHTDNIIEYTNAPQKHGQFQADACFTYQKNIICAVLTADCLPVLIADKDATVVAAIHCGWKGLFSEILPKTITKMQVNPSQLQCWLGPCISYKPYEVSDDFRQNFITKDKEYAHCFYLDAKNKWHADLKKIAVYQLQQFGVKEIVQSPYCTYDNKGLFYSYRRDGETGRMASMIWLI
ncbi:MAG TPA: peptidoglycan editing factor PgeF [Gammaproteobacteria bacterium]|nr:peptidoglycan editing factor PgeF [Xanthomonadales bacterium]HOP21589.1 peptidoglycan editing factor PgeF [Gammaproteobacteria bacterium]HPI95911.1 peptidoglycan editing factor PgeF [Gammaproteobacteria bacterium]HPQ87318.1 peptidoglycan editing factor PgeF [Gammaproteobacteria bacterium]